MVIKHFLHYKIKAFFKSTKYGHPDFYDALLQTVKLSAIIVEVNHSCSCQNDTTYQSVMNEVYTGRHFTPFLLWGCSLAEVNLTVDDTRL